MEVLNTANIPQLSSLPASTVITFENIDGVTYQTTVGELFPTPIEPPPPYELPASIQFNNAKAPLLTGLTFAQQVVRTNNRANKQCKRRRL
jgi:hypothetical protein